jgi:DNA modification methylase
VTAASKVNHPAQFSQVIRDRVLELLDGRRGLLLDPFAGPGQSLPLFVAPGRKVLGYEIEKPWADAGAPLVQCVDSTKMPLRKHSVSTIVTSPVFGNRFADHHNAKDTSRRRSYTHDMRMQTGNLGYELDPSNAGRLPYGPEYEQLHRAVWRECWRVAKPGAMFLLNVSDFVRGGQVVNVSLWHLATCVSIGWEWVNADRIVTPRLRHGANSEARVSEGEWLFQLRKKA